MPGWQNINVVWDREVMRLWMTTEVMKVYIRLSTKGERQRRKNFSKQSLIAALISKILLTLQSLFNWNWDTIKRNTTKSTSKSEASCVHTVSQSLLPYRLAQPDSHLTRSLTQVKEREGAWAAIWVFISFHYITFMARQMLPFTLNDQFSYDLLKLWKQ